MLVKTHYCSHCTILSTIEAAPEQACAGRALGDSVPHRGHQPNMGYKPAIRLGTFNVIKSVHSNQTRGKSEG